MTRNETDDFYKSLVRRHDVRVDLDIIMYFHDSDQVDASNVISELPVGKQRSNLTKSYNTRRDNLDPGKSENIYDCAKLSESNSFASLCCESWCKSWCQSKDLGRLLTYSRFQKGWRHVNYTGELYSESSKGLP